MSIEKKIGLTLMLSTFISIISVYAVIVSDITYYEARIIFTIVCLLFLLLLEGIIAYAAFGRNIIKIDDTIYYNIDLSNGLKEVPIDYNYLQERIKEDGGYTYES